jgi:hypothetical protein
MRHFSPYFFISLIIVFLLAGCSASTQEVTFISAMFFVTATNLPTATQTSTPTATPEIPNTEPVVEPDEEKIDREEKTIEGKQVLSLLSQKDDVFILRYFLKNDETLYVSIMESQDPAEIEELTPLLEHAVNSMQFVP